MKSKLLALFALMNLAGFSASAGERSFYWTGKAYSDYGPQDCQNSALRNGEWNAKRSCHEDHGMSQRVCQNGYISSTEVVEYYSPYTKTCQTRVYITVNF